MKHRLLSFLIPLVVVGICAHAAGTPNILFIHMEDMGVHIPAYGDRTVATPELSRLAAQGVVFERARVTAATCASSRGSLFTGLYPHQNGIMGFIDSHGFRYREGVPTFIQTLKRAGYRCGLTYKTGVKPESAVPFDFRTRYTQNKLTGRDGPALVSNSIDNFRAFLQELKPGEPFYFQAQTPDTHTKWQRPDFIKPGSDGWPYPRVDHQRIKPWPSFGRDFRMTPEFTEELAAYYRAIQRVDWYVGRLLAMLDEFELTKNTLVIFSADHGPSHLLRGKTTPYEHGLHVPFIARWPGVIKPGIRSDALVSFVDLSPTFQDVAGLKPPAYLPGHSLVPVFKGRPAKRQRLYSAYVAHTTNPGSYWPTRTIFDGRHKLIHHLNGNGRTRRLSDGYHNTHFLMAKILKAMPADSVARRVADRSTAPPEFELYDLRNDPGEIHNLVGSAKHADIERTLRAQLRHWREHKVKDPFIDPDYLAAFNRDYTERLAQYEQKRREMSGKKLKQSKWSVNWDHRIPAWNPKPYLPNPEKN